jgi:hypothetical protein
MPGLFDATPLPTSPTGQTTSNSGVSSWAQPYVTNYLNQAQNLVANQQTPGLLNQSYVDAAGLQLPGGFATATELATAGGRGSLSTAPIALQYGQQGAQYGYQAPQYGQTGAAMGTAASRAGDLYAGQATDPAAMRAYMSPYMQNVTDYQKQQAVRDYQIEAPKMAAQAVGSGAFGGNRLTLQQSEANRGLQNRLAGIDATGQQQAFQAAQQAQQFGAGLGLQGLQTGMQGQQVGIQGLQAAMQGAQTGLQGVQGAQQGYSGATQAGGTLGNIAAQQAQARLAQLQLQNQFGLQQQQFPYQQQQFLRDQMSGLPIGSTTQQSYQSPPNPYSQLIGLGGTLGTGYLAYRAMTGAEGGLPEDFKEAKGYAEGGNVMSAGMGGMGYGSDMGMAEYLRNNPEEAAAISAAAAGNGGMLSGETPTSGMFVGGNRMSPEAAGAMSAGIAGLMPTKDSSMYQSNGPMGAGMSSALSGSNEDYVRSLYSNMLGREADQGGYQHNLDLLNSGKINAKDLAGAFRTSSEGQRMPQRVSQLMGAGMPGSGGLAELAMYNATKGYV